MAFHTEFWRDRPLAGMAHLHALPGSPRFKGETMESIVSAALADVRALDEGGANAIMIENFFDSPFPKGRSPEHTISAMAVVAAEIRRVTDLPLGINVLRNDARSAIAIASVVGAQFVRVNVFVGAEVTDQGIIEGAAREALLYRRELRADVEIWADVFVKHAAPLASTTIEDASRDAVERGGADALIVSGAATGAPADPKLAERVKSVVPHTPVLIGSGFNVATARDLLAFADGAIVGTSLKRDGLVSRPVDVVRVRALRVAMDEARPR